MNKLIIAASAGFFLITAGPVLAGDAAVGKQKSATCAACHGADGNSATGDFPRIAGQQPDYIVKALSDYKSGARKDPIMGAMAAALSAQDMSDLAAYFSSQQGLAVKY
ncbi:MAG: c-type cytochrome [Burkholderiales bacterium]